MFIGPGHSCGIWFEQLLVLHATNYRFISSKLTSTVVCCRGNVWFIMDKQVTNHDEKGNSDPCYRHANPSIHSSWSRL